jgi:hypothetical protein
MMYYVVAQNESLYEVMGGQHEKCFHDMSNAMAYVLHMRKSYPNTHYDVVETKVIFNTKILGDLKLEVKS